MSLKFEDLPKVAQERITTIVEKTSIPQSEVMKKYDEYFNLTHITAAPTEELRHNWATIKLHADLLARPPLTKHNIIPVGVDSVNTFGKTEPGQTFFAYDLDLDKLISVRADRRSIPLMKELVLGEYYENFNVSVSDRGRFFIDDRVILPEPSPYIGIEVEEDEEEFPESIDQLLTENLGVRQIQMKDFGNSKMISKRTPPRDDGRTFVINTDWVCIRNCFVINNRRYPIDGLKNMYKGSLNVTDRSLDQDITTEKGVTIRTRMPVWVDERFLFPPDSLVHLWGTVEYRVFTQTDPNDSSKKIERKNFQMNAYYVYPEALGPEEVV